MDWRENICSLHSGWFSLLQPWSCGLSHVTKNNNDEKKIGMNIFIENNDWRDSSDDPVCIFSIVCELSLELIIWGYKKSDITNRHNFCYLCNIKFCSFITGIE